MIANAYAAATDNIPPQALYDNPGFWVAVAFVIFVLIFVDIPFLNVVLIPIKGENDLDILENCK